jgi:hypothetical protein
MRYPTLVFVLLCVAASLPTLPKRPNKSVAIHQGAGAAALISRAALIVPPAPLTNIIAWQYPPGIVPSNFWWNIESSTDLRHWSVSIRNATGAYKVTVKKTDHLRAYRISGRILP